MVAHTVHVDWIQENRFILWDRDGFPIVMAHSPNGVNGADLLPLSLIGCFTWDVMDLLKERGVPVTELAVSAESQQDDEPPWQFRRISIHFLFRGVDLDMTTLQEAVHESESKFCSIYATLRSTVDITTEIEIITGVSGN